MMNHFLTAMIVIFIDMSIAFPSGERYGCT